METFFTYSLKAVDRWQVAAETCFIRPKFGLFQNMMPKSFRHLNGFPLSILSSFQARPPAEIRFWMEAGTPIKVPFPFGASLWQRSCFLFSGKSPESRPSKNNVSLKLDGYEKDER